MELRLLVEELEHLKDRSVYNCNYYQLPISLNNCDILYGESDDDNTTVWELGYFNKHDGEFVHHCYLGESYTSDYPNEFINLLDTTWTRSS